MDAGERSHRWEQAERRASRIETGGIPPSARSSIRDSVDALTGALIGKTNNRASWAIRDVFISLRDEKTDEKMDRRTDWRTKRRSGREEKAAATNTNESDCSPWIELLMNYVVTCAPPFWSDIRALPSRTYVWERVDVVSRISLCRLPFDSSAIALYFVRLSTLLPWKSDRLKQSEQPRSRRLQIISIQRPIGTHMRIWAMNSRQHWIMLCEWTILALAKVPVC